MYVRTAVRRAIRRSKLVNVPLSLFFERVNGKWFFSPSSLLFRDRELALYTGL